MHGRPRFKPHLRAEVVLPDLVFLVHEAGYHALEGRLPALLAPHINGRNSVADIAERLDGEVTVLDVDYGLSELRRQGYLAEDGDGARGAPEVLRDLAGADADLHRLKTARVSVTPLGAFSKSPLGEHLRSAGAPPMQSQLDLVAVDDYLCEELEEFNRRALRRRRRWMLVKPVGTLLCVGPLFHPPRTGCWACLARRLREHRPVEAFLEARGARRRRTAPLPVAAVPPGSRAALRRAAAEALKCVARGESALEGALLTLGHARRKFEAHEFLRWEGCPVCGRRDARRRPVALQRRKKVRADESGSRSTQLKETFARLRRHVSPVTGIVHELRPYYSDKSGLAHVYLARHAYPPGPAILSAPPSDLYWRSWGKGTTALQAKTSALCEALERYSGIFRGTEARKKGSYRALGGAAIHPNACMNFSEEQYRRRDTWNRREARHNWVPQPFDEERRVEWTPVWSLTEKTFKYVPTAYCYYGYPLTRGHDFCRPDSNGNAAGSNLEEAILQGFLELVERDCVALWWYNRLPRPEVDLGSFGVRYFDKLRRHYQRQRRRLWVLDLTSDFGIPAFAALSRTRRGREADYLFGFGAHFDTEVAILRALTEMNQFLSSVARDRERRAYSQAELDETFLLPDSRARPRKLADYPRRRSNDLRDEVNTCVRLARERGLETLALDQTRPDTGLAAAKVIVPGLRQFWARFAPGRLYEVPAQLGWRREPLREDQLNPAHLYM